MTTHPFRTSWDYSGGIRHRVEKRMRHDEKDGNTEESGSKGMISLRFFSQEKDCKSRFEEIQEEMKQTRREWERTKEQLDHLTDPDLVDSAIYRLNSLEKRCMYLMKELKALQSKVV